MNIEKYVIETASLAKLAARKMAIINTVTKNNALNAMADALIENTEIIIEANTKDMVNGREKGLTPSLLDRLLLDESRIKSMAQGLRDVALLEDPIGEVIRMWRRRSEEHTSELQSRQYLVCRLLL